AANLARCGAARARRSLRGHAADRQHEALGGGRLVLRTLLKSKIHRATVTEANLDYEGSITIDGELADAADLWPNERVEIYDVTNGNRLATYVIRGEPGSGVIAIN